MLSKSSPFLEKRTDLPTFFECLCVFSYFEKMLSKLDDMVLDFSSERSIYVPDTNSVAAMTDSLSSSIALVLLELLIFLESSLVHCIPTGELPICFCAVFSRLLPLRGKFNLLAYLLRFLKVLLELFRGYDSATLRLAFYTQVS